jgi:hexosaminidase
MAPWVLLLIATIVPGIALAQERSHHLMPVPAVVEWGAGALGIDGSFLAAPAGAPDPRLERAVRRFMERMARQTGIPIGLGQAAGRRVTLTVAVVEAAGEVPRLGDDESYTLSVADTGARVDARTTWGALRALETVLQLVEPDSVGFRVPAVRIVDRPRFPWRGLLIDVARHWIPPDVIRRNLDAMAAVKLNVLHWHLTEDQGFRVESRVAPRLHQQGSDGFYYTQDEIREVVAYAADRGVRVVPEFDVPGHTTAWVVGHPELAAGAGPFSIERKWGVFDPTMDPTRDTVYAFLDAFFGEMVTLFPDEFLHIGGDEVNGKQWNASPAVARFRRERGMNDNHDLQMYFNRRLQEIVTRHGKRMAGWDEIFHPDLPRDVVVQSWRGREALVESARRGYLGILSNGYYLDHILPAVTHYANDPLGELAAALTAEERDRVLGGEACMWAEFVTAETIDSRIWPRTAAIAERLWSPAHVADTADMYRRLDATSRWLEWTGVTHRSSYPTMLARLTGGRPIEPLQVLADLVEPVKNYQRPRTQPYTSLIPLNRLVDAARPESDVARRFGELVDRALALDRAARDSVAWWLVRWRDNDAALRALLDASPALAEVRPLADDLRDVANIGLAALGSAAPSVASAASAASALERAAKPKAEVLLMIVPAVKRLVEAAATGTPG